MKLTAIFTLALCLHANAKVHSQNVTLSLRKVTLQKVFKEIKKQTDYDFLYTTELLDKAGTVDIDVRNTGVEKALEKCLEKTPLTFSVEEKTIIIKLRQAVQKTVSIASPLPADKKIVGKITDSDGKPLQSVSVILKGSPKGTYTDINGNFEIDVPENSSMVLVFSYVGMETREISVDGKSSVTLVLNQVVTQQQDIVVVGYASQRKINLTGAVVSVGEKQIENRGVANVSNILAGQVPGLTVIQSGGAPGRDQGTINIRGLGNLNGVTSPLIVLDGVQTNDFSQINPNDIASISVLKDAASASIYGLNAANGVVVITTKRGVAGKMKVSYNFQIGQSDFLKLPQKVNAYDLAVMLNEANTNDGAPTTFSASDLQKFRDGSDPLTHPNTDWVKQVFSEPGTWIQHDLALQGGTENTKYNISLGYLNQDGLMQNTGYKRYSFRTNFDQKVSSRINVGFNLAITGRDVQSPPTNQGVGGETWYLNQAFSMWANDQVRYSDGRWAYPNWSGTNFNPVAYINPIAGYSKNQDVRFFGSAFGEIKIVKGLKLRGVITNTRDYNNASNLGLGADLYRIDNATGNIGTKPDNVNASMPTDPLKQNVARGFYSFGDLNLQALLTYETSIKDHGIKVLAGAESRKISDESNGITRSNLSYPSLSAINAADPTGQETYGFGTDYKTQSFFGRINYNYGGRYLMEGNLRSDASSRFALNKRNALFPSFALGWVLSKEEFFKVNAKAISNVKFRASWGKLGNEQIANYLYLSSYNVGSYYIFDGTRNTGANEGALANPNITWESTTAKNLGLDLGLFNNKLEINADYFSRTSKDFLFNNFPAPATLGAAPPVQNAGAIQNSGFEIIARYNYNTGKVKYYVSANFAKVKNKITDLGGTDAPGRKVGDPVNNIYGYVAEGIFQDQGQIDKHADQSAVVGGAPKPGDIIYKDLNGDGKVDPANDRQNLGSFFPGINYGISMGAEYKGFDLSMVWQGTGDVKGMIAGRLAQPFWLGGKSPIVEQLDRWTPDGNNADARFPIISANRAYNYVPSSWWVTSTAYLKLRNLQLGYSLPENLVKKIKISRARIFVSGENLILISPFKIMDPESITTSDPFFGFGGTRAYPTSRRFLTGISITF